MSEQPPLLKRIAWFAPWKWKRRTQVIVVALLAFVGYPLSIGPASVLVSDGWINQTAAELFYLPLVETANLNTTSFGWLVRYIRLFHTGI